jgi:hypothetical protein
MWTLSQAIDSVADRLASTQDVFFDKLDLYVYLAVTTISKLTKGVKAEVTGTITNLSPTIDVAPLGVPVLGSDAEGILVDNTWSVSYAPLEVMKMMQRDYAQISGFPRWFTYEPRERRLRFVPAPIVSMPVQGSIPIVPARLTAPTDNAELIFGGNPDMAIYLNAMVNFACHLALLKERYDGDAERFLQLFITELQMLGVNPSETRLEVQGVVAPGAS